MRIMLVVLLVSGCASYPEMTREEAQKELDAFFAELKKPPIDRLPHSAQKRQ